MSKDKKEIKKTTNKKSVHFLLLVIMFLTFLIPTIFPFRIVFGQTGGNTYYVSKTGSDSNPGTITQPWLTINKATNMVAAGDIVYIRAGIYSEAVTISRSGTSTSPITIMAYVNEIPIIDGNNNIPGPGGSLLNINGNYIRVSGIEIRNSAYMGVYIYGSYNTVDNLYVHHNQQQGIFLTHGQYSIVENSRIYRNSLYNEYMKAGSNASGLSAARQGVSYATIRNNVVWENWGEGISTYEADHITIEGNISHDNFANIYISDATNVLCQRNFVYANPSSYIYSYSHITGILMGDEKYNPASANISIINNIAYNNLVNLHWWQGLQGGGMNNVLIANNTFVNATGNINLGQGNVIISVGTHQNVRFINNLVQQDGTLPVLATVSQPGVTYSHNLWSKTPLTVTSGPGDVIGDPKLSKIGSPYAPEWYLLSSLSPAIDKALTMTVLDYFLDIRGDISDIGADEAVPLILTEKIFLPMLKK